MVDFARPPQPLLPVHRLRVVKELIYDQRTTFIFRRFTLNSVPQKGFSKILDKNNPKAQFSLDVDPVWLEDQKLWVSGPSQPVVLTYEHEIIDYIKAGWFFWKTNSISVVGLLQQEFPETKGRYEKLE